MSPYLPNNNITIEITDNKTYKAENNFRRIRQKRYTSKLHDLKAMYRQINALIVANKTGDSLESLQSSFICIKLNEVLKNNAEIDESIMWQTDALTTKE